MARLERAWPYDRIMRVSLLPAVDQLALLRSGKLSSAELADECLQQITRLNPALNAFAEFDRERVQKEAASVRPGPLSGLPMTVKSSIEVAGYRAEIGSRLREGKVSTEDARAVAALRAAGATIVGTTNCPEFLMAYETSNLLSGRTCNPWDLERSAGGSSGGEAAAIAAGFSAGGLGSDSGGSVREPAHFTGICSLKPTPGRVSAIGHLPACLGPFSSLGAVGPMARTIADIDLFFRVLCDASCAAKESAPVPYRAVSLDEAKRVPIAWFEDDTLLPVTAETRMAVQAARRELESAGFHVQAWRPEGLEEARKLWRIFFLQCGAMFYASMIEGQLDALSPIFREFLQEAAGEPMLSPSSLLYAWADMDQLRQRVAAEMQRAPILILPVCAVPAFRHGERQWLIEGQTVGYWDAMRFTQWFNVLAFPAAVVPVGQSAEGLPIGVQVAGRPYEDELVLAVASVLDRAFGYRPPPMAL